MTLRPQICCALISSFILWPCTAQSQTDSATARVLFEEGRKLIAQKQFTEACPKFEESYRLDSAIGTLLNLADCWERTGRTASAWARFLEVAELTKRLGQVDRERLARARATALEPRLSKLRVEVSSPPTGLELSRDGTPFGAAQWGMDVPIDPGSHTLEAKAPGRKPWTTVVDVPGDGKRAVVLIPSLPPDVTTQLSNPPPKETASAIAPQTTQPAPPTSSIRARPTENAPNTNQTLAAISTPTWILAGIGVTGLSVGTVFIFQLRSKNEEADAVCPTGLDCTDDEIARYDRAVSGAKTAKWVSGVSFAVGGTALASSALLTLLANRESKTGQRTLPILEIDPHRGLAALSISRTW